MAGSPPLQPTSQTPSVDIMNDPRYETNTASGEDGMGDADTCRICRGEGSDSEPLFHPCKCSGSIKFVHQDCLMEWLSHSQKKHCELCKTPFRFTKLYSPNMPQTLPLFVLLRHIVIHTAKNLATWFRLCLVVAVWLGCLPYAIRQVWRVLFWFSDGGWPRNHFTINTSSQTTSEGALDLLQELQYLANMSANGTSPVTPLQASQTSPAIVTSLIGQLTGILSPVSFFNPNHSDPLATGLFRTVLYGLGLQNPSVADNITENETFRETSSNAPPPNSSPSLLSEISFLRNLTRHAYVNQLVITVAEGYVITIVVVICFILIFLIREWVVQQQPGINMGAGFNAEFPAPERLRDQEAEELHGAEPEDAAGNILGIRPEPREVAQRPMARVRRRHHQLEANADLESATVQRQERGSIDEPGSSNHRPTPMRDALSPAAEIQRQLEEPRMTEEFLAIWRRADSNPEEVLRIIEKENKGDQMRYWVNAMKVLQTPAQDHDSEDRPIDSVVQDSSPQAASSNTTYDLSGATYSLRNPVGGNQTDSGRSSTSAESWIDVSKPIDVNNMASDSLKAGNLDIEPDVHQLHISLDKGKGKMSEPPTDHRLRDSGELLQNQSVPVDSLFESVDRSEQVPTFSSQASHTQARSRATSDGPQVQGDFSTLASSNWSFRNLPEAAHEHTPDYAPNKENVKPIDDNSHQPIDLDTGTSDTLRDSQAPFMPQSLDSNYGPVVDSIGYDGPVHDSSTRKEDLANVQIAAEFESDAETDLEELGPNPFHPNVPFPEMREPLLVRPPEPQGILASAADFFWDRIEDVETEDQGANDAHVVHDLDAEAPFVPVQNGPIDPIRPAGQDNEVVEAAIAAGIDPNDQDVIDDAEDFEGIMELVGMRGPIFSLVQNALFSAVLLSLTVAFGAWIPYNIGRVSLLLLANPGPAFKLPLKLIFGCAAFLQDLALSIAGFLSYCVMALVALPISIYSRLSSSPLTSLGPGTSLGTAALHLSYGAVDRIMDGAMNSLTHFTESELFTFSAASHESLITLQTLLINIFAGIGSRVVYVFAGDYQITWFNALTTVQDFGKHICQLMAGLPRILARSDSWVISLEVEKRATPLDLELSVWSGLDRFWATIAGYTAISILGALYVRKGSPFSTSQLGRDWEATIIDILNQAGGVMKVILIISIEMLVFPLYCGLLLDAALLPLFEDTTIMSRLLFTFKSPLTSVFVHWFVGTCYMFHFALFVSMCRKIMRKGVLYFIRDPDDPTFHPVRDVLERNVATQLRKILFSAFVYGGLVVVCLGGVVWGLAYAFRDVLPIHWSSNEPVLEFPIDLLFYNFLMPLAVRVFKPSDGLHAMYSWWFRRCARLLRLTWFMFDERKEDEEGYHARRTWSDAIFGVKGDPSLATKTENSDQPFVDNPELRAYFRRDGRYVRAPASDQVRIPKDTRVFLEVDEFNQRLDGKWDRPDGVHGKKSGLYKQVYVPPWFRFRIFLFILSIWLFAALTGVSITIVPLVFGRHVFAALIPSHVRKNDVYAFSIGIYILGSLLYAGLHIRKGINYARTTLNINAHTPKTIFRRASLISAQIARIAWTYGAFLFILPTLFAFLVECYLIVPLHTYFAGEDRHVVHFVQSWTLGLLYVKLTTRIILWHGDSRPAHSLRRITRNGYLNPDAWLATRCFILPAAIFLCSALLIPWVSAQIAVSTFWSSNPERHVVAYRYSYPLCLCLVCIGFVLYLLLGWLSDWRTKIKDEVYLIGERLHNFGEKKVPGSVSLPNARRLEA